MWGATGDKRWKEIIVEFQSTLPVWGATQEIMAVAGEFFISIHAPHAGRRPSEALTNIAMGTHFNPLIPQGMSPVNSAPPRVGPRFQPTLPMRGATLSFMLSGTSPKFQSTLPVRGATGVSVDSLKAATFQPTPPCGSDDLLDDSRLYHIDISTLSPPCGSETIFHVFTFCSVSI